MLRAANVLAVLALRLILLITKLSGAKYRTFRVTGNNLDFH